MSIPGEMDQDVAAVLAPMLEFHQSATDVEARIEELTGSLEQTTDEFTQRRNGFLISAAGALAKGTVARQFDDDADYHTFLARLGSDTGIGSNHLHHVTQSTTRTIGSLHIRNEVLAVSEPDYTNPGHPDYRNWVIGRLTGSVRASVDLSGLEDGQPADVVLNVGIATANRRGQTFAVHVSDITRQASQQITGRDPDEETGPQLHIGADALDGLLENLYPRDGQDAKDFRAPEFCELSLLTALTVSGIKLTELGRSTEYANNVSQLMAARIGYFMVRSAIYERQVLRLVPACATNRQAMGLIIAALNKGDAWIHSRDFSSDRALLMGNLEPA